MKESHIEKFIRRLKVLQEQEDRAALAALRRALSGRTDDLLGVFQHIGYYLPSRPRAQDDYILVAALFASHLQSTDAGNMGSHFADLRAKDEGRTKALERRFTALLKAHPDDLAYHLRQAVSLLKSNEVPVNWRQLLYDVRRWGYDGRPVQREWATAFWGRPRQVSTDQDL